MTQGIRFETLGFVQTRFVLPVNLHCYLSTLFGQFGRRGRIHGATKRNRFRNLKSYQSGSATENRRASPSQAIRPNHLLARINRDSGRPAGK